MLKTENYTISKWMMTGRSKFRNTRQNTNLAGKIITLSIIVALPTSTAQIGKEQLWYIMAAAKIAWYKTFQIEVARG